MTVCAALAMMLAAPAGAASEVAALQVQGRPQHAAIDRGRWTIPGQWIVVYRPGTTPSAVAAGAGQSGLQIVAQIPELHAVVVRRKPRGLQREATASIASLPWARSIEPDIREQLFDADCTTTAGCAIPNDSLFPQQWYLENDAATVEPQSGGSLGVDIDAPLGWALDSGSTAVKIAIVDTGIDEAHPDVGPRVILNQTLLVNQRNYIDYEGHGTAVAGVAAAIPNNAIGIAGVAYNASLMNIKTWSDASNIDAESCGALANGIAAAANDGAQVINVSAGAPVTCSVMAQAVTNAWNQGSLVVAAAGNQGTDQPIYPAAFNHVIAVAAIDAHGQPASFTSYGASWVELAAPGVDILTTLPTYANALGQVDYGYVDGTSFSAPMVAGAAALLFAQGLTNQQVAARLFDYANPIPGTGTDWRYGLLDVCNSIAAGQQLCPRPAPTPSQAPAAARPARPALPSMALSDAYGYVRQSLLAYFGGTFRHEHHYYRSCVHHGRSAAYCYVTWYTGDTTYYGYVSVLYELSGNQLFWTDHLRIKRFSDACYYRHHGIRGCPVHTSLI